MFLSFIFILISIAIFIILFILWVSYGSIYDRIVDLIKSISILSSNSNKMINYYQLMLYNSITLDDINFCEGFDPYTEEDIFTSIYSNLEDLYEAKKRMKNLQQYSIGNIDKYFNFTCETFYENIFTTNSFAARGYNLKYKILFILVCQHFNAFQSKNYKQIFSMLFEMIQLGINQINDHTYEGLIMHKNSFHFLKTTMVFLIMYYYTFEILGIQIQRQTYQKLSFLFESYIHMGFAFYYVISFAFLLIIILVYVHKLNRIYLQIHELKNVFKICNSQE